MLQYTETILFVYRLQSLKKDEELFPSMSLPVVLVLLTGQMGCQLFDSLLVQHFSPQTHHRYCLQQRSGNQHNSTVPTLSTDTLVPINDFMMFILRTIIKGLWRKCEMNNILIMVHNFHYYTIISSYTLQTIQENKVTVEYICDIFNKIRFINYFNHQQFQHLKPESIYSTFSPFNMAFNTP